MPVTLLFGENGTGKSSTLNAIEWCLFGTKECTGAGTGIRERLRWQIENRFGSSDVVRAILQGKIDGTEFTLTRVFYPGQSGRSKERLEFVVGGSDLVDSDAEGRLLGVIRCSFRDFLTTVYQHQDRKSTRLNSSHGSISYAVFCLKKKK